MNDVEQARFDQQYAKLVNALKLQSRPLRLEVEEMRELKTPCILHWDLSHFVVLNKAHKDSIEIVSNFPVEQITVVDPMPGYSDYGKLPGR